MARLIRFCRSSRTKSIFEQRPAVTMQSNMDWSRSSGPDLAGFARGLGRGDTHRGCPSWRATLSALWGHQEVGRPFVLIGYGEPGHGSTGQDERGDALPTKRAGLNRYEAIRDDYLDVDFLVYDFDSGLPENNVLEMVGLESDLGFGDDEVCSANGDSGGPTFIGGAIAGVTAFGGTLPEADVTGDLDSSWGEAGFDTRVSGFREFILDATDGEALFVPEPGDFDFDGTCDGADFLAWQRGESPYPLSSSDLAEWQAEFGAPDSGDFDDDGDVDGADFLAWQRGESLNPLSVEDLALWQEQFGICSTLSSSTTIPESSTLLLSLLGLSAVGIIGRRRSMA